MATKLSSVGALHIRYKPAQNLRGLKVWMTFALICYLPQHVQGLHQFGGKSKRSSLLFSCEQGQRVNNRIDKKLVYWITQETGFLLRPNSHQIQVAGNKRHWEAISCGAVRPDRPDLSSREFDLCVTVNIYKFGNYDDTISHLRRLIGTEGDFLRKLARGP